MISDKDSGTPMTSLLNHNRPLVFCPGCSHETVVHALDKALNALNLIGPDVAIVTDIGCSGLFDTFFKTNALHGLHGRALTYATGLKIACPNLKVITVMGDGGLGIGGAHVLSSCRRNLDITLLVLNNFNYGMTGGQCSATTPAGSNTASGFLNQLETPLDICQVGKAAGVSYAKRIMSTDQKLADSISEAIEFQGFTITDIWGICPGRYSRKNKSSLKQIKNELAEKPIADGFIPANHREEFGTQYRKNSAHAPKQQEIKTVEQTFSPTLQKRLEILFLGAAGQRINTAGEILCLSAMTAGMNATLKNDYPITVLRGHSICEAVICPEKINYTGINIPNVIVALSDEGVRRKMSLFSQLDNKAHIISARGITIPATDARISEIDFKELSISPSNWALASLAALAVYTPILSADMLIAGLENRFSGKIRQEAESVVRRFMETI